MDQIPPSIDQYTNQSISTIHHALRASRRRLVIGLVAHRAIASNSNEPNRDSTGSLQDEPTVTVRQLAREIVAIEEDVSLSQATGEPYHNAYTALIQTHLPKLDDIAAVDYNSDRKTVEPDRNLIVLSMAAAITSPLAQMLFHSAVADLYRGGSPSVQSAIDD